ncbi:MAG: hypothetical protein KAR05_07685 [Candidatus Omnitrophica bacterium]|nr:hypothetical protein [Candidatus Omnitrophota bacterium]
MSLFKNCFNRTVSRNQFTTFVGFLLILFLIYYLSACFTFFLGPAPFNQFAENVARHTIVVASLAFVVSALFILYAILSVSAIICNQKSRVFPYSLYKRKGSNSLALQLSSFSSLIIILLTLGHILDVYLALNIAPQVIMSGRNYGLYGVIFNKFSDPLQATIYISGGVFVGFHLSHSVESCFQIFGWRKKDNILYIQNLCIGFAILMALACSGLPLYVLVKNLSC